MRSEKVVPSEEQPVFSSDPFAIPPSPSVARLKANAVALGDAWRGAPPPFKVIGWAVTVAAVARFHASVGLDEHFVRVFNDLIRTATG